MKSPVIAWQLVSPDPESSARFYADVFGWTVAGANPIGYRSVDTGGTPGGIWPAPPGAHAFAQLILAVADADSALKEAVARGASVLVPKTALPDGDVMAVLRDPQGMPFGIVERRAGR